MDPDPLCAIRPLADQFTLAGWGDVEAATNLAKSSNVVTFEIEKVSLEALQSAAQVAPVRPGPEILHLVQNRIRQKSWLQRSGFPVGPFKSIRDAEGLRNAISEFGHCFVKAAEGGYDGRSQLQVRSIPEADEAWDELGGRASIAEQALELEYELSVLVARRPNGDTCVYPPAMNRHEKQILVWSMIPAPVSASVTLQAQALAQEIAVALSLEGLLVVEMFVTRQGQLLVNELAPRPHNSYHASERACVTGQFEQLIRAVCNLPLGSAEVVRPAAIVNLLGDLWMETPSPDVAGSLSVPETRIHLYGKSQVRRGRKMGHISAAGLNAEEALGRAMRAKEMLARGSKSQETTVLRRDRTNSVVELSKDFLSNISSSS
jgi:5-(carboxyamino)imidazole ribonucleotide synthase